MQRNISMQNNIRSLPLCWMNWCLFLKVQLMLKNLCICWRKVIMDKKTTRLLRNTLIPIIRLIRKASLPSWPVIIRVMDCIWIHRTPVWIRRKRMKPLTSCNYIWSIIRKANVLKKLRTLCSNCRKSSPIRNCWQSGCISTWVPIWETTIFHV